MARKTTPAQDLFVDCVKAAKNHVGGEKGFAVIGVNLQHALVATEILRKQQQFSRMIDAESLVSTIGELYTMLIDQFETQDY